MQPYCMLEFSAVFVDAPTEYRFTLEKYSEVPPAELKVAD